MRPIDEIEREAVRLVTARGATTAQAAHGLDVHSKVLRRWIRVTCGGRPAASARAVEASGGAGHLREAAAHSAKHRIRYSESLRETGGLAGLLDLRCARFAAKRIPCLAHAVPKRAGQTRGQ